MYNIIQKKNEFKKICWKDIPDFGFYSDQLISFLNENLISYFPETLSLTPSMINNYVKNKIIPKPVNKKYYRKHIAILIVVIILKVTFSLDQIKEKIDYQLSIMSLQDNYNEFMNIFADSMNLIKISEEDGTITYDGFKSNKELISTTLAIQAFWFQTITRQLLAHDNAITNNKNL